MISLAAIADRERALAGAAGHLDVARRRERRPNKDAPGDQRQAPERVASDRANKRSSFVVEHEPDDGQVQHAKIEGERVEIAHGRRSYRSHLRCEFRTAGVKSE